jgi:hypothetical protein
VSCTLLIKLRPKILFNITTDGTFTPIPVQKKIGDEDTTNGNGIKTWVIPEPIVFAFLNLYLKNKEAIYHKLGTSKLFFN